MAMTKRRIAVLGSTGSIGSQALMVARLHADRFQVVALVANRSKEQLFEQVWSSDLSWRACAPPSPWRRSPRICGSASGCSARKP